MTQTHRRTCAHTIAHTFYFINVYEICISTVVCLRKEKSPPFLLVLVRVLKHLSVEILDISDGFAVSF